MSALAFVAFYYVLPLRPAIFLALLVSLACSQIRPSSPLVSSEVKASHALAITALLILKMEVLAEIDHQWIAATLICSSAWARASILAIRPFPITGFAMPATASRLSSLAIGIAPLVAVGVWPEPVWGFWVAAVVTGLFARLTSARGWASSLSARWIAAEALFMICVLMLLSIAALLEVVPQETPAS